MASQQLWDPAPVLYFESSGSARSAAGGPRPLRIWFAYLSYHAGTGRYPIDAHLRRLGPCDHVFLFLTWHRLGFDTQRLRCYAAFPCQVVLCANTPEEHAELVSAGVRSIYFNHCAALDERIFCITPAAAVGATPRPRGLIVNAAFAPFKRLGLAALVPRAAFLGYRPGGEYHPAELPPGTCLNLAPAAAGSGGSGSGGSGSGSSSGSSSEAPAYLSPRQVAAALNCSSVGGMLSEEEGACWASTEYLLCGLPVVSTPSRGGRHVWYTPSNSLIAEPTQEAVAACVKQALELLGSGVFDRQRIRREAVERAHAFRATLNAEVQAICSRHGVQLDAAAYFAARFVNKMGL